MESRKQEEEDGVGWRTRGGREIGDPQSVSLTRGSLLTMGARNERKE